jgi:hypothetical protein
VLEERLNDLNSNLGLLPLFLKTLLLLPHAVISQSPQSKLTKKGLTVFFHSLEEVGMIEMEDLLHKITNEDTNHPDLLILHKANRSFVETVFTQCSGEGSLHFIYVCFMKLNNFLIVIFIDHSGWFLDSQEDRCEDIEMSSEETVELVKHRDAIE